MSPLTNNSWVFKIALVLYLDHARGRNEKLCCPQPTLSVGLYFILLFHTLLRRTVSAHLRKQCTFTPHVHDRTILIYVIMTSFRTLSQGSISVNYTGSNHLISCTVEGN